MNVRKAQSVFQLMIITAIIVAINVISRFAYERFDLTKEKRFTLSAPTLQTLENLQDVIYVNIFLEGEFPSGFKRLRNSTRDMLDEFRSRSGNKIEYKIFDPFEGLGAEDKQAVYEQLVGKGLFPTNLKVKSDDGYQEKPQWPQNSLPAKLGLCTIPMLHRCRCSPPDRQVEISCRNKSELEAPRTKPTLQRQNIFQELLINRKAGE